MNKISNLLRIILQTQIDVIAIQSLLGKFNQGENGFCKVGCMPSSRSWKPYKQCLFRHPLFIRNSNSKAWETNEFIPILTNRGCYSKMFFQLEFRVLLQVRHGEQFHSKGRVHWQSGRKRFRLRGRGHVPLVEWLVANIRSTTRFSYQCGKSNSRVDPKRNVQLRIVQHRRSALRTNQCQKQNGTVLTTSCRQVRQLQMNSDLLGSV